MRPLHPARPILLALAALVLSTWTAVHLGGLRAILPMTSTFLAGVAIADAVISHQLRNRNR